jgi:large subunit ribosomal protein L29
MKAAKYREMGIDELEVQIDQLRTDLFNFRVGNTTKELQDTSKLTATRRELARVLTVLTEKQRETAEAAGK